MVRLQAYSERRMPFGDGRDHLVSAIEAVLPLIQKHPSIQAVLPPGMDSEVAIMLGGAGDCRSWGCSPKALGFFAVLGARRFDKAGQVTHRVSEDLRVYLNIDAWVADLAKGWLLDDEEERAKRLFENLVTIPHELFHALEWFAASAGRAPVEVFDQDRGEAGLLRIKMAVSEKLIAFGRSINMQTEEDVIEWRGRGVAYDVIQECMVDLVRSIGDDMRPVAKKLQKQATPACFPL